MLTAEQWRIVRYVSEEVYRQRDDARFVPHMLAAWEDAIGRNESAVKLGAQTYQVLTVKMITKWGKMVCPVGNVKGYRSPENPINVQVGNHIPPHYDQVPRLLGLFCEAVRNGAFIPSEAYKEFELIHPFRDGNGRTGKILYNFLLSTLLCPVFPPNFFGSTNP